MQLALFGYAIRQDVRNLPTVVYDASRTQESRALVAAASRPPATSASAAMRRLLPTRRSQPRGRRRRARRDRDRRGLRAPHQARPRRRGAGAGRRHAIPPRRRAPIAAAQLVGQTQQPCASSRAHGAATSREDRLPLDVRVRPLYNPALKSALFIVPGIIGMILSNILIIITAMAIVRERETGTLEQLIVTPLTPHRDHAGQDRALRAGAA